MACWALRLAKRDPAERHYARLPGGLDAHATAAQARSAIGADEYDAFFRFAFVRNPWDLRVSIYHYVLQRPANQWHDFVKAFGSFDAYVEYVATHQINTQSSYLVDQDGQLLVDFVGRVENAKDDFAQICQTIGVHANLPHLKQSRRGDYRTYYTDRTAELIAACHAEDVERFGYTFG